ncbi:MAG: cysteine hydrolase family protein [Pseudomonadota bacterium]
MSAPKTLLEMAGANLTPPKISDTCLVLIDMQNEYREGPLAVTGVDEAVEKASGVLHAARHNGTTIIHVAHKGKPGSLFDRDHARGQIIDQVAPLANEPVIEKGLPNAFAGTDLLEKVKQTGKSTVLLVGFMTHMCVSSTARAALDLGLNVVIDAESCGTRDLPDGRGRVLSGPTVHEVALTELSDRFAIVAREHDWSA